MSRGFEVYHYGIEGSTTNATRDIQLMTRDEWDFFRVQSYKFLHPEISHDDAVKHLADRKSFIGDLGNWSTPLYIEFNDRLRPILQANYRSPATDIVVSLWYFSQSCTPRSQYGRVRERNRV